jgi:hypothetical protein
MNWVAFAGFAAALVVLFFLERWIHRHLQGLALLIVGDPEIAIWLYALPLLPGVILHEISHALAGILVGARVGRISILPARAEGRIQLGFVPVEATGPVRTAIIGLAPLVTGCLVLLLIGSLKLGLDTVGAALAGGDWSLVWEGLVQTVQARDAWVWVYLAFAISNTMMPSRSDMRAWPVILIFLLGTASLVAVLGYGPALAASVSNGLRWLAIACALTVLIDLPFAIVILAAEQAVSHLRGVKVEYQ